MSKNIDVFPAVAKLIFVDSLSDIESFSTIGDTPKGTRSVDRCRVVVLNDVLMIAVDSPEGPQLVFRERAREVYKTKPVYRVITEKGKLVAFSKDDNCGCGSRLRGWNPYGAFARSEKDPE